MSKKFITGIFLLVLILAILWLMEPQDRNVNEDSIALEKLREIATNWIENNSPTYLYDGFNLNLIEEKEIIENSTYRFIFNFQSRNAGYGNRINEIIAQIVTPHEMEIIINREEVILAITDNVFSEIKETMIQKPEIKTIKIKVFFGKQDYGENLFAIEREIPYTQEIAKSTLIELINGPTTEEKSQGFFSLINTNTKIKSLKIDNGIVSVDFSQELEQEIAGSTTVIFIRNQIEETLKQFETVNDVVITIDERIDDILQP